MAKSNSMFMNLFHFLGFGGSSQYSGVQKSGPSVSINSAVDVTEDSAMAISALFNAVRITAETVSGIPMKHTRLYKGQWQESPDTELHSLLQVSPNPHMSHIDFWEAILYNLCLRGNGYALIVRNAIGGPIALYPLAASQTQPVVLKDGTGWYLYNVDGVQTMYAEEDVMHFKLFGNGRVGMSPLEYGARSMGLAIAADQYASTFFQKGAKPGGVLTIDRILSPKQRAELRESFSELHEGADAAHKMFVLEAGMKYTQVQLSPETAQLLDSRKFNVKDVARFTGVPSFLLNDSEGSTSWGTGLEQQMLGFFGLTIRPYTARIAATCRLKLLPVAKQRTNRFEYDYDELMAVDLKTKAEYYSKLVNSGLMSSNEGRSKLRLPQSTQTNSDSLMVQGAMVPITRLGEKVNPASTPVSN